MGIKRTGPAVFFLIMLIPVLTYALNVESGRVRLEINEKTGTFSLFSLSEKEGQPLSLLYSDDPRTSYFSIAVNNRIYNLPASSDFRREIINEKGQPRIVWTSGQIEVRQEFRIIRSVSSEVNNGLAMSLRIRNISSQKLSVGLRYLLDTYLGENRGSHFVSSENRSINGETVLKAPYPRYILSPREHSADSGLMLMLNVPGVTVPDSVIFANWKRLNESSWSYDVSTARSFSNPPYSINDSAIALYFDPQPLLPGDERLIDLAFGSYAQGGYLPASQNVNDKIADILSQETETGDPEQEVALVRELIAEIDLLMETDQKVPEEKIQMLRQLLETLKARKADFED